MGVNFLSGFDFSTIPGYRQGGAVLPAPDQYVGELQIREESIVFEQHLRENVDYYPDKIQYHTLGSDPLNHIVVILESPHRFEYDSHKQPIGLIKGVSGDNFFALFAQTLQRSSLAIKPRKYHVILMNAVQYQTSCGTQPLDKQLRDMNWLDVYENHGGEDDFQKRLFSIKPRYTINLCTGGNNPIGLRSRVNESLDRFGLIKGKHYTEGNHPASWNVSGDTRHAIII